MRWDIFCKVIDNHGDAGVCWRLSTQLARRGEAVRLCIDDPSLLGWMAPAGEPGVTVVRWDAAWAAHALPGDVVIEAFGCELDEPFVAAMAAARRESGEQPAWVNLEYLSAERFVERCHGLPSPVQSGPGAGLVKHFFYPGFTPATGGLLRESDLAVRQAGFERAAWLHSRGIGWSGERLVSLFCYEPAALPHLLAQLACGSPTRLLVTAGRAAAAVRAALALAGHTACGPAGVLRPVFLPLLSQHDFDHLLWSCDINFVRGEDSLVRALLAAKPFVWQAYPQDDDAHHAKLTAFLDWLQAPPPVRTFHAGWNGAAVALPPVEDLVATGWVRAAHRRVHSQPDLVTQLLAFVQKRRSVQGPRVERPPRPPRSATAGTETG